MEITKNKVIEFDDNEKEALLVVRDLLEDLYWAIGYDNSLWNEDGLIMSRVNVMEMKIIMDSLFSSDELTTGYDETIALADKNNPWNL